MSRFLEVLNSYKGAISVENVPDILRILRQRLDAQTAHFQVAFTYFMAKLAPVTGPKP